MLTTFERNLLNEFRGIIRRENPQDGSVPFDRETLVQVVKNIIRDLEEMKEKIWQIFPPKSLSLVLMWCVINVVSEGIINGTL